MICFKVVLVSDWLLAGSTETNPSGRTEFVSIMLCRCGSPPTTVSSPCWCFPGAAGLFSVSICLTLSRRHFLLSVGELAVVSVFVSASPFPGGCPAALGPSPLWRVSCLYCCKARPTASSTNRLLTLSSSASSGSDRRRPPEEMTEKQKRMFRTCIGL